MIENSTNNVHVIWIIFMVALAGCRKPYEPDIIRANHNYLVVEGAINGNKNGITTITLSRTRNITDSVFTVPELHAQVMIEAKGGGNYFLQERGKGIYVSPSLNLNANEEYRLRIRTSGGFQYQSDFVPIKETPPIDSLTWEYDTDVTFFVNTHDPSGNSRYYRWEYTETWEYHAFYDSHVGYRNGQIYFKDSSQLLNVCWDSSNSVNIELSTSIALSEDIVRHVPIAIVRNGSPKISEKYSILVRQYALTQKAFQYWELLEKTSEELGSFFDAQPAQLIGNIHSIENPNEPVIGYVSASTIQEKRIFIRRFELPGWRILNNPDCTPKNIPVVDASSYLNDATYAPAYFVGFGDVLAIARTECVDCTKKGGTTVKPLFWQ